jgi:hypothetical protein
MKSIYRKYFATVALVWVGCFILFFFIYMLMLVPQKKSKNYIAEQLAEKKQTYESALRASREEAKARLNEQLENLRGGLKSFVIDFEDLANLIFDISQIASENNVASFSIKGKDSGGGSEVPNCRYICENHIDISFTAAGFNQFAAFLNTLERHRPVVFVDKFTITRSHQDDSGHKVDMELVVFVKKKQDS